MSKRLPTHVRKFLNLKTGEIISCIQWQGDNFKVMQKFCLGQNVRIVKDPCTGVDSLWVMIQAIEGGVNDGVWGEVEVGEWISWNGKELFPIEKPYDNVFGFVRVYK